MTTVFHKSLAKTDNDFPRRGLTFVAATACLICTFIAAAIAIPMMAEWRSGLSLSESEMAMTVVSYFAGCVLTLFFFARLSNFFGRKPVVLAALLLGMAASLMYANALEASESTSVVFCRVFPAALRPVPRCPGWLTRPRSSIPGSARL